MSEARLRTLRMVGFKSFAERTVVEFGPGISAIVGPNGSGKSNLADALRWALGEQGRSLRTRRAEDLIFAGSSSRRAIGMADVTLVIDNGDRLLPVDYSEIELGRRLYRSGENEYLLNRQRVRLRDLVDLLDEANLADNAFLFIGQGTVDQALALRPEERRPLFEEAAGIRKHERRRRQAESELTEAEANLERLRDLLAELRPQARRLAAQAEQQEQRRSAGAQLAAALVAAARARLGSAQREAEATRQALAAAHREADAAMASLRGAEDGAASLTAALAERAEAERAARERLEAARSRTVELRLAETRLAGEERGLGRDRERLAGERASVVGRVEEARRAAALPVPEADIAAEDALRDAERQLDQALRERDETREAGRADTEREGRARRAREARQADVERARRRAAEAARRLDELAGAATTAASLADAAAEHQLAAAAAVAGAEAAEAEAEARQDAARAGLTAAEARLSEGVARETDVASRLAAAESRAAALEQLLADRIDERTLRSARSRGGRLIAEGLEVEPSLRVAIEAALGEALSGLAVSAEAAVALRGARAVLFVADAAARGARDREGRRERDDARARDAARGARDRDAARERDAVRARDAAVALGGGALSFAVRRDPGGHVSWLIARAVWVPDLERALELCPLLPPGWRAVTPAGEVVTDEGLLRVGPRESVLDRRAELESVRRAAEGLRADLDGAARSRVSAEEARIEAAGAADTARHALDAARRARRVAEETGRASSRTAEGAAREAAWQSAQLDRLAAEVRSAGAELQDLETQEHDLTQSDAAGGDGSTAAGSAAPGAAVAGSAAAPGRGADADPVAAQLATMEARIRLFSASRARRAADAEAARGRRSDAEERRRRAEIALAMDISRLGDLDREMTRLVGQEADLAVQRDGVGAGLASAASEEGALSAALSAVLVSDREERTRLVAAETAAAAAREQLRAAEARSRAAEVTEVELRLQVDSAREGLLVELAGIGTDGLAALLRESADPAASVTDPAAEAGAPAVETEGPAPTAGAIVQERVDAAAGDDFTPALEAALDAALAAWGTDRPEARVAPSPASPRSALPGSVAEAVPSPARLGILRRRYNELGASNPFAAREYAEVSARLGALDAQRDDLEAAIRGTRDLIGTLNELIARQFRETFAALEGAFARRFRQLFDGGEAQLILTDPEDLSTTGVEITARPPGKKRQPLAMLSGGERALTAVALLLAMLEVRPVPFCVLDEVDAALDEANVGRFSSALRGLAETIQFIVITHNRGTIEAADALYGVTVGDDAVSRVVSLRLGDRELLPADAVAVPVGNPTGAGVTLEVSPS